MPTVLLLHYAAPPVVGGVERTLGHHARLLTRAGWQVVVLAGRGDLTGPGLTFHRIPRMDSQHAEVLAVQQELAQGRISPRFHHLREALRAALAPHLAPAQVVVAHNVVTLHKNLALTAALHDLVTADATPPLVAWCHDFAWADERYLPDLHPGWPWDLLATPWPRTRYVAISHARARALAARLSLPLEAIAVVPPGVDADAFFKPEPLTRALIQRLRLWDAAPLVLLPARITRRKNIGFAFRVLATLRETLPRATLVITGPPGPHNPANQAYLDELLHLRADLGLERHAHFLYQHGPQGQPLQVPDAVVADFFRLADALLVPSLREGFGIPVLEAGLVRLPAWLADIPELREAGGPWVQGYFDPHGDPRSVAQAMARFFAQDPAYRQRRRVLEAFRWETLVYERVLPLLQGVVP